MNQNSNTCLKKLKKNVERMIYIYNAGTYHATADVHAPMDDLIDAANACGAVR